MITIQDKVLDILNAINTGVDITEKSAVIASHFNIVKTGQKWHIKGKEITIKDIIIKVSEFTGVPENRLKSRFRDEENVRARYIIYSEARRLLGWSFKEIAAIYNQNHSTAVYAKKQIEGGDYSLTQYYNKYLLTNN